MTLASHDPDRIRALHPPTWSKWAPAIVGAWVSAPDDGMKRPCDLADLAPPESRGFITDAALSHLDALQEHGGRLRQQQLYEHLCQELAADLAERLQAGRYTGNLACTLLGLLIANAPAIAAPACRQLPVGSSPELAEAARRGQAQLEPATVVDELAAADADTVALAEIVPQLNVLKLDNARLAVLGWAGDPGERDGGRAGGAGAGRRAFVGGVLGPGHSCGDDAARLVSELFGIAGRVLRARRRGERCCARSGGCTSGSVMAQGLPVYFSDWSWLSRSGTCRGLVTYLSCTRRIPALVTREATSAHFRRGAFSPGSPRPGEIASRSGSTEPPYMVSSRPTSAATLSRWTPPPRPAIGSISKFSGHSGRWRAAGGMSRPIPGRIAGAERASLRRRRHRVESRAG